MYISYLSHTLTKDGRIWCLFSHQSSPKQAEKETQKKQTADQKDPDQPCFTKKEVRDILFERNELKTNLFLVQEELNYYQRCVDVSVPQRNVMFWNINDEWLHM